MKIEVDKVGGRIRIRIEDIGLTAEFEFFNDATQFIQSIIRNVNAY